MESARRACSFFLARLRSEVDRLHRLDFPGHHPGPHRWLQLVAGEIDTAEAYLQKSYVTGLKRKFALDRIADAEDLGNEAYELLEHMAGADAEHIPHQVVAPFQRWVDALGIRNTIFFRAEHAPNYELSGVDFDLQSLNDPSLSLVAAHRLMRWPVLRVTVPSQAMGMLPHFAVVAHELGHAIEDRIRVPSGAYAKKWSDCEARVAQRLGYFGNDQLLAAKAILSNWVAELKADAIGFLIAGPAFFFALCGFLELSGAGYGVGETHPPSELRRRLLFGQMVSGSPSFVDIFKTEAGFSVSETINSPHITPLPRPSTLFRNLSLRIGKENAAICVELIPLIEDMAAKIFQASARYLARTRAKRLIYTSEQLRLDLQRHLISLGALIPPIEFELGGTMHATSLASVLNVGWAALLSRSGKVTEARASVGDLGVSQMEKLHELLLKAVELSEARQLWDEHQ